MSEATAYMIADILQDTVLNGGGTPKNVAVKTGTTNFDAEYMKKKGLPGDAIRDSWAVGFTTKTVMAMWYGYDYADPQHCLRNLPSSIEKDKLYKQLIYSGAFEAMCKHTSFVNVSWLTLYTIVGRSLPAGAEITTFFAPATM